MRGLDCEMVGVGPDGKCGAEVGRAQEPTRRPNKDAPFHSPRDSEHYDGWF